MSTNSARRSPSHWPEAPSWDGFGSLAREVPEFRSRRRQTFCEKLKAQEPSFVANLRGLGRGPSNVCTGPWVCEKLAKVFKIN